MADQGDVVDKMLREGISEDLQDYLARRSLELESFGKPQLSAETLNELEHFSVYVAGRIKAWLTK